LTRSGVRCGLETLSAPSIPDNLSDRIHLAVVHKRQGAVCDLKFANGVTFTRTSASRGARRVPLFDVALPVECTAHGTDNI
jgi:hypothetical protein